MKQKKDALRAVEIKLMKQVPQRYPGDRKWKDEDIPSEKNNPKEQQEPLPKNKKKSKK